MKTWWLHLSGREKQIVGIGGIIVAVLLIYVLIWNPLSNAVTVKHQTIISQQHLLRWMSHAQVRIQQFRNEGIDTKQVNDKPLLSLVETVLSQKHLSQYIQAVQQPQPNELMLTLQNIPFDSFIDTTQWLWKHDAVTVKTMDVKKTNTEGLVNVTVVMQKI